LTYVPSTLIDRTFREKIVLVGVQFPGVSPEELDHQLDELALLVDTAGADIVGRVVQRRDSPTRPRSSDRARSKSCARSAWRWTRTPWSLNTISLRRSSGIWRDPRRTAIDRTAVILDIFAQNARTPEGKAQVELALLEYDYLALDERAVHYRNRPVTLVRAVPAKHNSKLIGADSSSAFTTSGANSRRSTARAKSSARVEFEVVTAR